MGGGEEYLGGRTGGDAATVGGLRRMLLAIMLLAIGGTFVDLMFLDHHADVWQMIPLVTLGVGAVVLVWSAAAASRAAILSVRLVMVLFVVVATMGIVLHFRAGAEFRETLEPGGMSWELVLAVLRSPVPPTLAPATLLNIGLMGLAYTWRHPALRRETPDA